MNDVKTISDTIAEAQDGLTVEQSCIFAFHLLGAVGSIADHMQNAEIDGQLRAAIERARTWAATR